MGGWEFDRFMPMALKQACLLLSGGLDSAVLAAEAARRYKRVFPVYVACGLRWERAELHWLRRYLKALDAPALAPLAVLRAPVWPLYKEHWSRSGRDIPGYRSADRSVYLPGRNVLLLAHAGVFCAVRSIPVILMGILKGNPFPDAHPRFLNPFLGALGRGVRFKMAVQTPFARMSKAQVRRRGRGLPLHLTFSCLSPKGFNPCGRCNKCAERDKVLKI